ncbi:TcpQ domain-containing protein [Burkholderia sp. HI2500]|uniref:TcpQ domain-containing protein n=1 Tax=Burkholderia sp. HI2500 TaxID=2015358 RepID=UPI0015C66B60|nr:TcpQ domain-containing protein [Burkholderia sp. HI2500]
MRKHIEWPLRGALAINIALAAVAPAHAADQVATSSAPAIHLAPYLPRYTPPAAPTPVVVAPAASTGTSSSSGGVPPLSSDSLVALAGQNSASNVAPAASLSPSETVVAAPVTDAPSKPMHHLTGGVSLESQLREWAKSDGWTLSWNVGPDWIVPNDTDYVGDFPEAATKVIQDLAANGADVRGDGYPDNRTFVVHEAGND